MNPQLHPPTSMRRFVSYRSVARIVSALGLAGVASAQSTTPAAPTQPAAAEEAVEEVIVLSPFQVDASGDVGYMAKSTLAGSRLKTSLRDVASQVQVMTPEFLQDIGAVTTEDALRYSLNTENTKEFYDVATNNNATFTNSPTSGNNRTRGLGQATPTFDFFNSSLPSDSYNIDRVTFVYGANAILFGTGNPSGAIDSTLKRAKLNKDSYEVSFRVDNNDSWRTSIDINEPLIKNVLAIRVAGLKQDQREWRKPNFDKQERLYATAQFSPGKWLNARVWYEHFDRDRIPLRNTVVTDGVTPWIAAGRPTFDNRNITVITANPLVFNPRISNTPTDAGYNPLFETYLDDARPLVNYGNVGGATPAGIMYSRTTVTTRSLERILPSPNNFDQSLQDGGVFPLNVNINGNALHYRQSAEMVGGSVELNPFKKLFIELAAFRETFDHKYIDLLPFGTTELRVDANEFLPDRVTSNPNVRRYYFESGPDTGIAFTSRRAQRATVNYEFDFTKRDGWSRWLGRHQVAGFYLKDFFMNGRQRSDFRIINNPASLPQLGQMGDPADTLNVTQRDVRFRFYVDDPQNSTPQSNGTYTINLPFDGFAPGVLPGTDWQVATLDNPYGARDPQTIESSFFKTKIVSIQSFLWKDRIIVGYGKRRDNVSLWGQTTGNTGSSLRTGTVGINNSGRVNPTVTTTTVTPGAPAGATGGAGNAGYAWWYDQIDPANGQTWRLVQRSKLSPTDLKSVVVHPFKWISLKYYESKTNEPQSSVKLNLDGSIHQIGAGLEKDYGINFNLFDEKISLGISKFETTQANGISQYRAFTGLGGINAFRDAFHNIERSVRVAHLHTGSTFTAAAPSTAFANYSNAMAGLGTGTGGNTFRELYDVTSDKKSTGYEMELIANPTANWRLALTVSKTEPVETNIAPQWFAFLEERLPVWYEYRTAPVYTNGTVNNQTTVGGLVNGNAINSWNFIYNNNGSVVPQTRLYRANFTTRYSFTEGLLKGSHIGLSARWRDKTALGYGTRVAQGSELKFRGQFLSDTATLTITDINQPIYGPDLLEFDAFMGYQRKLLSNRVTWKVQLNIRNLLDDTDRIPQRINSDATTAVYTLPDPRTFILTNTFSF